MRNCVQSSGANIDVAAAPYAVESGQGVLVGRLFGIASADADNGDPVTVVTEGVFDIAKNANDTFAVGDEVNFNATDLKAHSNDSQDSNSGGTLAIGICVEAAGAGALTVRTKLTPSAA
jgi:predicted RecA/RadA family phage recombinase